MKLSQRGQSSVADALAFFLIASTLALFLLGFANSYGNNFSKQAAGEQFRDYASSALKVIMYSSVPRDSACTLDCCSATPVAVCPADKIPEYDFLLATVKEDFADDGAMDESAPILRSSIKTIMQPLASGNDYVFYFYSTNTSVSAYPYFLWYKTVTSSDIQNSTRDSLGRVSSCNANNPSAPNNPGCHHFYYCRPDNSNQVDSFLFSIPNLNKSSSKIILAKITPPAPCSPSSPCQIDSEVHFAVWPSASLVEQNAGSPTPADQPLIALKCCQASEVPQADESACQNEVFIPGAVGGLSGSVNPLTITMTWNTASNRYDDETGTIEITNLSNSPISNVTVSVGTGEFCYGLVKELDPNGFSVPSGGRTPKTFRIVEAAPHPGNPSRPCAFDIKVNGSIVKSIVLPITFTGR